MKKLRNSLILFYLTFTVFTEAQEKSQIDVFLSPTLSYRKLETDYGLGHTMGLRYDVGINYNRFFLKNLSLGTGFYYSRMGYNLPKMADIDSNGNPTGESFDLIIKRDFIEFPINCGYILKRDESKNIMVNIGFINQILINQEIKINGNATFMSESKYSYSDLKEQNTKTYNLAIMFGGAYNKYLDNNLILEIMPFFKYGLLNMNNIHDYSIGLKIGLGYKL
jgi:hypothetical protein